MNKQTAFNRAAVRNLCLASLFSALAYVSVLLIKFPLFPEFSFLKFDPKDIFIIIGALVLSPVHALMMAFVVPVLEFMSSNKSGIIGFIMNLLSSIALVMPVSFIYHKKRNFKALVSGLIVSVLLMTGIMLLWNYVFTPIFMPTISRTAMLALLPAAILPFNLLKGTIDAVIIVFIYLCLWPVLQRRGIVNNNVPVAVKASFFERFKLEIYTFSTLFIISLILLVLAFFNVI